MHPLEFYCWHFMNYPYLPPDFDEKYENIWITVPNSVWDRKKGAGLYNEYLGQLAYAEELGLEGVVLNEHHQTPYALLPSPTLLAAALTERTNRAKIVILGPLLALYLNPLRVAEEYAMLDNMSNGRVMAGFGQGGGPEWFTYNVPAAPSREQFWEAVDLIQRAWSEDGPFVHEGKYYPLRYVNPWPRPLQVPHPEIWIPSSTRPASMMEIAKRGHYYFFAMRGHKGSLGDVREQFGDALQKHGYKYDPSRMGILLIVYVSDSDAQAHEECKESSWYFLRNNMKGHLRREGRQITMGPGIPYSKTEDWKQFLLHRPEPGAKQLGDVENWKELEQMNPTALIVGGPETIERRLWNMIENAESGRMLIQFQYGNMSDELTRKSMRLFATKVAPALREKAQKLYSKKYPEWQEKVTLGAAQ